MQTFHISLGSYAFSAKDIVRAIAVYVADMPESERDQFISQIQKSNRRGLELIVEGSIYYHGCFARPTLPEHQVRQIDAIVAGAFNLAAANSIAS